MDLLPTTIFKEEFHANNHIEIDWEREQKHHNSSSSKQTFSQNIKDEDSIFENYSCNKCFELYYEVINHQIEFHDSIDPDRRNRFLNILQQAEIKFNLQQSLSCDLNSNNFDYEIIATLVKIPKIKQELNIPIEPTIHITDNTNLSSEESENYHDNVDNYMPVISSDDDYEYNKIKRKHKTNYDSPSRKHFKIVDEQNARNPKVECDICGKLYNYRGIYNHKRRAHPKVKQNDDLYPNRAERKNHFDTDKIAEKQKDSINVVGIKIEELKFSSKKRIEKSYYCDLCNDVSTSKLKILKHFKTVHRSLFTNEQPLIRRRKYDKECIVCGKIINGLVAYRCHMKQYHPDITKHDSIKKEKQGSDNNMKILCDICGKGFSSDRLKVHKQSHSEARPHKCTICDRDYRQKKQLQDHMNTHTGDRPYKCVYDGCDKTFAHNSARHAHLKLMHGTVKNHKCEFCSKLFAIRYAYIIHRRVHTNERPHGCNVCGNKFKTRRHLLRHMQIHTQEKPHKCQLCNKGFADAMGLKQHHRAKRPCVVPSAIVCTIESNSSQQQPLTTQPSQVSQSSQPTPSVSMYPEENLYKL